MTLPSFTLQFYVVTYISPRKLINDHYISLFNALHFGLFSNSFKLFEIFVKQIFYVTSAIEKLGLQLSLVEVKGRFPGK